MKRILAILLLTIMLGGCKVAIYDEPVIVIGKELYNDEYQYQYTIKLKYRYKDGDIVEDYTVYFYSNKDFRVGETIWIGNARGETLRD